MLTVIDIINRVLGYFNIADKPKGKAFTWIAFVANFYLLYIAIQNLRYPDFRIRGALFMLAFVVFLYFIALNFLYYFTNKTTRFDISPTVEKWLGSNSAKKTAAENELKTQLGAAPASADAVQQAVKRYPDFIVGLKARMSSSVVGENGITPLERAKAMQQANGDLPLMVHIGNNP